MSEAITILTVIIVSVLALERIISRVQKSKCGKVEIEFKNSKSELRRTESMPNLPELLKN